MLAARVSCLSFLLFLCGAAASNTFPRGHISTLLHEQALSHLAFHSNPFKLSLASLFLPRTIAIVGVEWGSDLFLFADNKYTVYAFEPASKFLRHLRSRIADHPQWDVHLIPVAAGNASDGVTQLRYDNENVSEEVPIRRVDDYVNETLGVFSLDIQGDELHVLQGSSGLLTDQHRPASWWIEAIACNEKVRSILDMLDDEYVFFDFVPWGMHSSQVTAEVPNSLNSFVFYPERPSEFDQYLEWMCEVSKRDYKWLQTDFLIVRRDLLTQDLVELLSSLAETQCGTTSPRDTCRLRALLLDFDKETQKEEL